MDACNLTILLDVFVSKNSLGSHFNNQSAVKGMVRNKCGHSDNTPNIVTELHTKLSDLYSQRNVLYNLMPLDDYTNTFSSYGY